MGPDFKLRENLVIVDPEHVPGADVIELATVKGRPGPVSNLLSHTLEY